MNVECMIKIDKDTVLRPALMDALAVLSLTQDDTVVDAPTIILFSEPHCVRARIVTATGVMDEWSENVRDDKERRRKAVKAAVSLMGKYYSRQPDGWGILRGVRPTKLAGQFVQDDGIDARDKLIRDCMLQPRNADILLDIHEREQLVMASMVSVERCVAVYIAIPFCPSRCSYCSFPAHLLPAHDELVAYTQAVLLELKTVARMVTQRAERVVSVYIGGGTPAVFPGVLLAEVIQCVVDLFGSVPEFTLECGRPELFTSELMQLIERFPLTRVCLNPQTLNSATLIAVGRRHSVMDVYSASALLSAHYNGIVNMDLIAGLPGEDFKDFAASLDGVLALKPQNITIHSLAIKRGSEYFNVEQALALEQAQYMLDYGYAQCRVAGYQPYYLYRQKHSVGANIGYAMPGSECVYNIMIINESHTVYGVGASAATKVVFDKSHKSVYNPKDYRIYTSNVADYILRKQNILVS